MADEIYARSLDLLGPDWAPTLRHFAALQRLLPVLTDHDTRRFTYRCAIAPGRIVSLPWHAGRLRDAREKRAAGLTPPLIHVTRFRHPLQTWYLVTDSMHRAWAAREAGAYRIGARIDGEVVCHPEAFVLRRGRDTWELWRTGNPMQYIGEVDDDVLPMAHTLGVATAADA